MILRKLSFSWVCLYVLLAFNPLWRSLAMNTGRTTARRLDEDISNVGVPPQGNQVSPLKEVANDDQEMANPPSLTDGDIRDAFLQMAQAITTQAQAVITQAQAMMTQANREVVSRGNSYVCTMTSRLRNFTYMNPPTLYGSRVDEDPQEFIDVT